MTDAFIDALLARQRTIAITTPVQRQIVRAHWGAPPSELVDLPCAINALTEPVRLLGFGTDQHESQIRVVMQVAVAKARAEDALASRVATAFWFALKAAFDADTTLGDTCAWAVLRGGDPTVPVILQHGGQAYIGLQAVLDVIDLAPDEALP